MPPPGKSARFDPRPAARALAEAWRDGATLPALAEGTAPQSLSQGRRIAQAMLAELDLPAVGFRALASGLAGPLLAPRLARSGSLIPRAALPGLEASAACLFPLCRKLPPLAAPYSLRRVLGALGPARAAIDLAAWRTEAGPRSTAAQLADLCGLGIVVVADPPRGAAGADPRALRIACDDSSPVILDVTPLLVAAAESARLSGGLPEGAALVAVGLVPAGTPPAGTTLAVRITGAGRASATLV